MSDTAIGLGAGLSGFAQGFAASYATAQERKHEEQKEKNKSIREMFIKHYLDPKTAAMTDVNDPTMLNLAGEVFDKEHIPMVQQLVAGNKAHIMSQPSTAELFGAPAAAPAAGAAPPLTEAPLSAAGAPAATPAAGETPIQRFQQRIPEGVTVPIKTREGTTVRVSGAPAAARKREDEAAYWQNFTTKQQQVQQQFPTADPSTLEEMTHRVMVDEARAAGRSVPKEAADLAGVRGKTRRKAEETRATTRARTEETAAVKEEQPLGSGEAALWFDRGTGRPVSAETSLSDARKTAVKVTPAQVTANTQLTSATQFLRTWSKAADVLHRTDNPKKAAMNALRYSAAGATRGAFPALPKREMDAIASLQEAQNNMLSLLRTGMGEKGNIGARMVERAMKTGPQMFETETTSKARRRFFGGMLAAVRAANGLPLPSEDRKFLASLRDDAQRIGIAPDEVDQTLTAIRQAPGLEGAGPTTASGAADDPMTSLMSDYGLTGAGAR